jgi:hypothetical protein
LRKNLKVLAPDKSPFGTGGGAGSRPKQSHYQYRRELHAKTIADRIRRMAEWVEGLCLIEIEWGHFSEVDSRTSIAAFTLVLELLPHCLDLWRGVIWNIGTLPGEDLYEVRTALLVGAAEQDVGAIQDEVEPLVQGPGIPAQSGVFGLVACPDMGDAVNGFGSRTGQLVSNTHHK